MGGAGFAATDTADDATNGELESIVVTAEKRSEKLQETPVAITALTATDLERAGVNNIQDVAALTPNLVIIDQLRPGIQTVSFRGFTTVQGGYSPFAIVVDGVAEPGQEFLKQELVDIDQVEVLRGPQGTLYGANAIAGAINIVTKPPTNEFEASAKLGVGQGGEENGTLTVSGPIIPDLVLFRVSAYSNEFNGLIPNEAAAQDADFAQERSFSGELLIKPTDQLDIALHGHALNGTYGALWLVPISNAQFNEGVILPVSENVPGIDNRHLQTYSAKVDYRFDDFTYTSITGYNNALQYATADGDFSAASEFAQTWLHNTNAWSEEMRLTSTDQGPIKWNGGLFYQDYFIQDATTFYAVVPDQPPPTTSGDHYRNKSWAVFGQASYEFVSDWTATLGGRYDRYDAYLVDYSDLAAIETDSHSFSEFQPKVSISYQATPNLLGYATFSKGFRPGGFNPATPLAIRLYQDEISTNTEIGVKSTLFDNHVLLDGAVFHTNFKNQQFFYSEATDAGIYTAIINIPDTHVNGAEAEGQYRPFDWLHFIGSVGYNNTVISHFVDTAYDDKRTPQVYGLTSDLSVETTHEFGMNYESVLRVDYTHRGEVYWDLANDLRTSPTNFINARLALQRADGLWSVALIGHNMTNQRTPAAVGANAFGEGNTLYSYNEPRQYSVEIQAKF